MERLEDEPDLAVAQQRPAVLIQRGQLDAVQPDPPGRRFVQTRQQGEQRRLAGPGGSDHGSRLAPLHRQRGVVQDGQLPLRAGNLFGQGSAPRAEHWVWSCCPEASSPAVFGLPSSPRRSALRSGPRRRVPPGPPSSFSAIRSAAATGLRAEQSWVAMLQNRVTAEGYDYEVINASIAGDTSFGRAGAAPGTAAGAQSRHRDHRAGRQRRAARSARRAPAREPAGHDRAEPGRAGRRRSSRASRFRPITGGRTPRRCASPIPSSPASFGIPLVGFLMEDVALNAALMQSDGMHPNAQGNRVMMENVWDGAGRAAVSRPPCETRR